MSGEPKNNTYIFVNMQDRADDIFSRGRVILDFALKWRRDLRGSDDSQGSESPSEEGTYVCWFVNLPGTFKYK